ncbi:type II toxin-antitoxin system HicB family antitoxin [Candidatus Berkelbacteria bacterium]|nr:type II toxin-antitoxin system HicB family antitoxin [Candidatus Berkelbacteria bacterium]
MISPRRFNIVLTPEPEGGYTVTVPSLPGCVTYGKTVDEAHDMAADAITGYLASLRKHHEPLPSDQEPLISSLNLDRRVRK